MTISQEKIDQLTESLQAAFLQHGFDLVVDQLTTTLGFELVETITIYRHPDGSKITITEGGPKHNLVVSTHVIHNPELDAGPGKEASDDG